MTLLKSSLGPLVLTEAVMGNAPGGKGLRMLGGEARRSVEILDRIGGPPQVAEGHAPATEGAGVVRVVIEDGVEVPERALVRAAIELRDSPRVAREVAERLDLDGGVEIFDRPLEVAQIAVGEPPVVVGGRETRAIELRGELDRPAQVLHGLARLAQLGVRASAVV